MALMCFLMVHRAPLQLSSLVFAALVLFSCQHVSSSPSQTSTPKHNNVTDRFSLLSFKSAISNDPHGVLTSWNDTVHFCQWQGITCGGHRHPDRVVALDLDSLDLVGTISPVLANLTFLRTMNLSNNRFQGHIPRELALLPRLQNLDLGSNALTGDIPPDLSHCVDLLTIRLSNNMLGGAIPSEFSSLSSLTHLGLSNNSLSGQIPPSLANVSSFIYIDLSYNQLSGGIPPAMGNLSSLKFLILSQNILSGGIPPSLDKLPALIALHLSFNNLEGAIPSSVLLNLSSLTSLNMQYNQLSGSLPPTTGQALPHLRHLYMNSNKFHGPIPMSLSNASGLEYIQLDNNSFSGTIPPNLGSLHSLLWLTLGYNQMEAKEPDDWSFLTALTNCTILRLLQLDNNNLGGMLPNSVANLSTKLQVLTMGNNLISGTIPPEIGNLVNLTDLDMGPNLLTGSIPTSIGMLQMLRVLELHINNFSGEIPSTLSNLTLLDHLNLQSNGLSGSIPASLGNCRHLDLLLLGNNMLTGTIPKEVLTISSLSRALDLSYNSLTGPIPSEVGSLRNLGLFDVSGNKLAGKIPIDLGKCQVLEFLYLDGNFFNGTIPSSLSALGGIQELDLSRNNLSGRIPDFLKDFQDLYYLNLSFNGLEGEVPRSGVFANVSAVSVLGNNKLCGGNPELHLPTCPFQASERKHHSPTLVVIILIVSAFLCLFLLFCLVAAHYWIQKSRRKPSATAPIKEQHVKVSYAELVRATNGFSIDNLIGTGSFGTVYKGKLDDDSMKLVAVKVLNLQQRGASKSFLTECEALRNIRHRNLVKILTACSSVDFRGNDFKAMVFEFMSNGCLDNWLHPEANEKCKPKKLNLIRRLNIAVDVASALDYLHHHGQTPIIHCDLKPSNILLDDDLTAHVGDFGLARILKKTVSKSSLNSTGSVGLKGTIGYVAPEYGMANRVSARGDVYSYGILLLEMFTGKRPTDDTFKKGLSLHKFVEMAIPEQVMDIMDKHLLLKEYREANDDDQNMDDAAILTCVASVLRIGLQCSNELPVERMEMGDIIRELHVIRSVFLRTGFQGERRSRTQLRGEGPSTIVQS